MAFSTTPRNPMMYFWGDDLGLTGTSNQRDNDHDGEQAEIHVDEIDNHLTHKNLITPDYSIDNGVKINFGGEITMILLDKENGIWGTSDGLTRNTKMFLLGLSFRNFAEDKSIFDKYVFRGDGKTIRFQFITEVGEFVDDNYKHTNDIVFEIVKRNQSIQNVIDDYYKKTLFNQNFFVLEQLEQYRDWVKNHQFKSDTDLLNAFENILNLYQVSWAPSENTIDDFSINSGERGVATNGISSVSNKVLAKFQNKYLKGQPENHELNLVINEKIKSIFSPIRKRFKPTQDNCTKMFSWVLQSYYTTKGGYTKGSGRGSVLDVVSNEIMKVLDNEMEDYAPRNNDGEIDYKYNDTSMLEHFKSSLTLWGWYKDLQRINKYFDNGYINEDGTRWIPILLKYERVTKQELTLKEQRVIQNIHINGKFVSYSSFDKLVGASINEIDRDTDISKLLVKYFVNDNSVETINYKNQFIESLLTNKVKDRTSHFLRKYNYIDNILGHCSLKSTTKNWVNINPNESGTEECEHYLSVKGSNKSEIRYHGINFYNLNKTTNGLISNDSISDKKEVVKNLDGTLGQLHNPNDKLENNVKQLLNGSEYDIFREDSFGDDDWVNVCSVGVIGDNVSSELPNNLLYKYRSVQIDNYLEKVFGDK